MGVALTRIVFFSQEEHKKEKKSIIIHNIKNPGFRQIHVDGAQGGLTPSGFVNLNFFSQRGVIPKGTEFAIKENGNVGEVLKNLEDTKSGIIREFEFGVYMDIKACKNLINFLSKKIEEFDSLTNQNKL